MVLAAYPFIEVRIDTSALQPVAERSPGVIAIVGKTPGGVAGGSAPINTPLAVDTLDQAADLFARVVDGTVQETALYRSLVIAFQQDPKPTKIYGVRVGGDNYAAALGALEAADDVTFVSLANEVNIGAPAAAGPPATAATNLLALKEHVENMSAEGSKRIAVAMINPATAKSPTYAADIAASVASLKSDSSRMILVAARGASSDVATAAMSAIAGFAPQVSMVLKRLRGVSVPVEAQFNGSEIRGLSEAGIDPIIQPALIVGGSFHFADGRTFTTDASLLFIDTVRVLDDIDFRLRAGLIGMIGDARITQAGMVRLKLRTEGILGPLLRDAVIDAYDVRLQVLDILNIPEAARTPTDNAIVATARANRAIDMFVSITYGPAVHRLRITLAPKF